MQNIICHILIAFLFSMSLYAQGKTRASYHGPKEKLHIYLLIGQSNMAGRAPFSKKEAKVISRCYLLNGQDLWESAKNPLNRYSTIRKGLDMQKLNPGYSFSKAMLKKGRGISIGLVVNAKGGSSIKQWSKGSKFYKEAVRRTNSALKTGALKGILWHQGESDEKDAHYLEKLALLIKNLRIEFDMSDLPFVAGQVNNAPLINEQIAKLPATVDFTGFASSKRLKVMDRWHFDTRSMKRLGERYAKEMLKLQIEQKAAQKNAPDKK